MPPLGLGYSTGAEMRVCVRSLEPEWAAAATEVKEQTKGKVKLAAVDATANQMLTGRYGVCIRL